jgi:hypothetical protein
MANKPVDYKQYDPKWAGFNYAAKGEVNTIKSAGCGVTCAAMIIASLKNKNITPIDTAKWSKSHGYKIKGQGTAYAYFKPQLAIYGLNCSMLNGTNVYHNKSANVHKNVMSELKKRNFIISCMGVGRWTRGGHYVLAYACDKGYVYINDPASTQANRLKAKIEDWQYEVKYYWKVEIPDDKKIKITNSVSTTTKNFDNIDWIKKLQKAFGFTGSDIDGKAGTKTLGATPTIKRGMKGEVIKLLQEKFQSLGYFNLKPNGKYGKHPYHDMYDAVIKYQKEVVGMKTPDGEFTAKGRSWKTILGLK